jgi:DNA-binding transcriptional ArsR family regulator
MDPTQNQGARDAHALLAFFKALADESRLKLVGLIAARERSGKELAALLALREPTISHHLAVLAAAKVVRRRIDGTTHFYRLDQARLRALARSLLNSDMARIAHGVDGEVREREVLATFLDGERLTAIPVLRRKRLAVLKWLARRFAPGVEYSEAEVNAMLKRHHPDAATLRRELVGYRMFARSRGIYRLLPEAEWRARP